MPVHVQSILLQLTTNTNGTNSSTNSPASEKSFNINEKAEFVAGVDFSKILNNAASEGEDDIIGIVDIITATADPLLQEQKNTIFISALDGNNFPLANSNYDRHVISVGEAGQSLGSVISEKMVIDNFIKINGEQPPEVSLVAVKQGAESSLADSNIISSQVNRELFDLKAIAGEKTEGNVIRAEDLEVEFQLVKNESQRSPANGQIIQVETIGASSRPSQILAKENHSLLPQVMNQQEPQQETLNQQKIAQAFTIKPSGLAEKETLLAQRNSFVEPIASAKLAAEDKSDSGTVKGFVPVFKEFNDNGIALIKSDVLNQIKQSEVSPALNPKILASTPELSNKNSAGELIALNQVQNQPSQAQLEVSPSFLSLAKVDVIDDVQTLKPGINSVFSQGLNLKQNFAPNLAMRIQWMFNQALSTAEIMMDPPEMGPLTVKIQQHNGETNIMFQVSQTATKEMLEESLSKLKEMLEQQGINLGETVVEQQKQQSQDNSKKSLRSDHSNKINSDGNNSDQQEFVSLKTEQLLDVYS